MARLIDPPPQGWQYWSFTENRWLGRDEDREFHEHKGFKIEENDMSGTLVNSETDLSGGKYIIWCPESNLPPRMVFSGKADAVKVAYGMAKKNAGNRFAVAKIEGVAEVTTVKFNDFSKGKAL